MRGTVSAGAREITRKVNDRIRTRHLPLDIIDVPQPRHDCSIPE
jgi:hypothetical protein